MTIATRFRTVVWAAGVGAAALGCYLVSLRVAAERAEVARTEQHLLAGRQEIRALQTELNTRSRLVQLERWNADVLALTAPKAGQYLQGEMQLASLAVPATPAPAIDTPAAAALQAPATVAQVSYRRVVTDRPVTGVVHSVSLDLDMPAEQPVLRHASLIRPVGNGLDATVRQVAFLDAGAKTPRP